MLDVEILRLKPDTLVANFEALLAVGADFGASELLVAGNDPDEQRLTDNFAALCDLAAPYGLHPHLEFMPWTDAKDLTQATRIVENAGRANGCVLVDAQGEVVGEGPPEEIAKIAKSYTGKYLAPFLGMPVPEKKSKKKASA